MAQYSVCFWANSPWSSEPPLCNQKCTIWQNQCTTKISSALPNSIVCKYPWNPGLLDLSYDDCMRNGSKYCYESRSEISSLSFLSWNATGCSTWSTDHTKTKATSKKWNSLLNIPSSEKCLRTSSHPAGLSAHQCFVKSTMPLFRILLFSWIYH